MRVSGRLIGVSVLQLVAPSIIACQYDRSEIPVTRGSDASMDASRLPRSGSDADVPMLAQHGDAGQTDADSVPGDVRRDARYSDGDVRRDARYSDGDVRRDARPPDASTVEITDSATWFDQTSPDADAGTPLLEASCDGAAPFRADSGGCTRCRAGEEWSDTGCVKPGVCAAIACEASEMCREDAGRPECVCAPGFERALDDVCTDINECQMPNRCDPQAFCDNAPGTYTCRCPAFFETSDEGSRCDNSRVEWQLIMYASGAHAVPFGSDLYVVMTFALPQTVQGRDITPAGGFDIVVTKLGPDRSTAPWVRRFGGSLDDGVFAADVDHEGNLLITGYTDGGLDLGQGAIDTGGERARFLAKLSPDGDPIWSHVLYNVDRKPVDQNDRDAIWEGYVTADDDDNVLFGARFRDTVALEGTVLQSAGGWDMLLGKFSPDGELVWLKGWGGPGDEYIRAVNPGRNGDLFIAGDFWQSVSMEGNVLVPLGDRDVFLAKLDGDGRVLWNRAMGGLWQDECGRMDVGPDGNPVLAGLFTGLANFGTGEVHQTRGGFDGWIAKWDSAGNAVWSERVGGTSNDLIWGVAVGPNNEVVVSGYVSGTVDFGEGYRTSRGGPDAFVAKYDSDGTFVWSHDFGGPYWDSSGNVRTDSSGRVYPTGWYKIPATLGGEPLDADGGKTLTADGMYVLQLAP